MKLNISLKQSWTLIILLAVLVPVSLVISWYGITTYQLRLSSALLSESQINQNLKIQIESEIKRYKTLLQNKSDPLATLLQKPDSPQRRNEINKLLRLIVVREEAIHEAIIFSPQAKIIAIFDPAIDLITKEILTDQQKHTAKQHWGIGDQYNYPEIIIPSRGREYIGSPNQHNDIISFNMAVPIGLSPVEGVLIVRIDIKSLWLVDPITAAQQNGSKITQNYMIDRRGVLLTRVKDSPYKPNDLITHIEITRTSLINSTWPANKPYIGINDQLVYGTVTIIPSLNWGLISEVTSRAITGPIWVSLLKIILPTLLVLFIFTLFIIRLANRTLLPIKLSCEAIDRVAHGDYRTSLKPTGIHELDRMTLGINRMMTARETAENEIRQKELEQRQMLDSMVNAVISIDEKGIVLTFNKAAEELFGYQPDEIIGTNIKKLMPEPYAAGHDGYLRNYKETGEARVIGFSRDVEGQRKNKDTFPLRLLVATLPDSSDGTKRFIGSCMDLTDTIQKEEQLRRSQKMDALGKLTGGIAHDYNNMLSIIMGYAKLLERSLGDNEKLAKYAYEIYHAGERGAKLTRKLLNFSSNKSADDKVIDLNSMLQDERNMLEKILTVRIKLELDLTNDLWSINLDPSDLEDAILNISINAMHAIQGHGQLTLQTKNQYLNQFDAEPLHLSAGAYVSLSITDTGSGMDKYTRDKIFEPFYSTKGDQGTGLGLSQVYGFVQRSNGAIKVYSEIGHGSRFTLYFPRHTSNNEEITAIAKKDNKRFSGTETILLVDDEASLLALNAELLTELGYKVLTADGAQQALQIFEHEHIDLLITDIIMPEMDGYQLAKIIKGKYPTVKIQLASGFNDNHHAELIDAELHKNILDKPFSSELLFKRIRELLDGKSIG